MKKMSKEKLAQLQAAGADIKPENKPAPKKVAAPVILKKKELLAPFKTTPSSPQMVAAIAAAKRAAEAAEDKSNEILSTMKEGTGKNREILNGIQESIDILNGNQVIKVKINRGNDQLMTDLDLIRANG